jgi:hypothetical protein
MAVRSVLGKQRRPACSRRALEAKRRGRWLILQRGNEVVHPVRRKAGRLAGRRTGKTAGGPKGAGGPLCPGPVK